MLRDIAIGLVEQIPHTHEAHSTMISLHRSAPPLSLSVTFTTQHNLHHSARASSLSEHNLHHSAQASSPSPGLLSLPSLSLTIPIYETWRKFAGMNRPQNTVFTAAIARFSGNPTQERKETCWNNFLATEPSEENQREFLFFLDNISTRRHGRGGSTRSASRVFQRYS